MENMFFVCEHAPHGDVLRTYQGMPREVVAALVAEGGNSFDFLTEEDYNARVAAAPPPL